MTETQTWQQTKHGLYKRFNFINFTEAFEFMTKVAAIAEEQQHHPRWENEWSVVDIWLITHEHESTVTDKDYQLAEAIDGIVIAKSESEHSNGRTFTELKLFTDGGSRGNPGPSASGFVLIDKDDVVVEKGGEYLGITTNNQAEYQAVKLGLRNGYNYMDEFEHYHSTYIDSSQVEHLHHKNHLHH
jgi:4a-hydroxytetrahydrobiopterin dehydratase